MTLQELKVQFEKTKKNWSNILDDNFGADEAKKVIELARKINKNENAVSILNDVINTLYKVDFTLDIRNNRIGSYPESWGQALVLYTNFLEGYNYVVGFSDDEIELIEEKEDYLGTVSELLIHVKTNGIADIDTIDLLDMKYYVDGGK